MFLVKDSKENDNADGRELTEMLSLKGKLWREEVITVSSEQNSVI